MDGGAEIMPEAGKCEWKGARSAAWLGLRFVDFDVIASPDTLALFAANAFPQSPPKYVRAVLWQYWFTSMAEKRATGLWWRRQMLGLYAPALTLKPGGGFDVVQWPQNLPSHE